MYKLIFLDFDGVLAIKLTNNYFPQIPAIIRKLHKKYKLCIASYNQNAINIIKKWNLEEFFCAIRCGSNTKWEGDYNYDIYSKNLSKAEQIIDMLNNELLELEIDQENCIFFDDDKNNIKLVNDKLPKIKTIKINGNEGLLEKNINFG